MLQDVTQWIIVPSVNDPGQTKMMPCLKMPEFFLSGMKGTGPQSIKNITLATNPFRISYYGKELVFSKYNYYRKFKKNHLHKVEIVQT
mmetsp:Transcript_42329/g.31005  ORF Transcript_42329/g.31005 Transcript_42329/m.31005 type:complete len:88 (-) Transcript_42329:334-597(-)